MNRVTFYVLLTLQDLIESSVSFGVVNNFTLRIHLGLREKILEEFSNRDITYVLAACYVGSATCADCNFKDFRTSC